MEASSESPITDSMSTVPFHHRAINASILLGLAIIGLLGNTLVIISVIITKKLRTITNVLVVNLAFTDFMSCTVLPLQMAGLRRQTGNQPIHETLCAIAAGIGYVGICSSVSTLVAIAFVRWYVITRSIRGHQGMHTQKNITIVVVVIWIESIAFMIVPPVLGFGTLGYSDYYGACSLTDANPLVFYLVMLHGAIFATALTLTLTLYALILRHVLRHNKKFRDKYALDKDTSSTSTQTNQSQTSSVSAESRPPMIKTINQKEIEITKNLFMVVCFFMLCFSISVVNFIIPGSSVLTLYGTTVMLANSVVNPIIYGLKHPNFQEVFKKTIFCRRE